MVTEDYVSFETAKLLKEKGFNEDTEHEIWYVIKQFSTGCHWNSCTYKVGDITREYDDTCCISMPTLQMAMKWLREEKDCPIEILWFYDADDQMQYWEFMHHKELDPLPPYELYETYENACEAAIKYCLKNLI